MPAAVSARRVLAVVFSKDRPLQLDAALRSIELHCADVPSLEIHVLQAASTPAYAALYRILAHQHPDVTLHREADFKPDLGRIVAGSTHVLFLVDDSIFVNGFSVGEAISAVESDPGCIGFSFRLGRNTTHCYTLDRPQQVPSFTEVAPGILAFPWPGAEGDFGYPLELSSSLYRTADIVPLLERLQYRNPNTLESALAAHAGGFRETHPRLACYGRSVAVSLPVNIVQTTYRNRVGGDPALSTGALADAYARGDRIDVVRYRGLVTTACHEELELSYERDPSVPTVSVVVPCYGQARYLRDTLESVVAQTFADWELIVVDDGSPDRTAEVAAEVIAGNPGRRIRLLRQSNGGLARARNAGIEISTGRYVLPLDADDMLATSFLERTVSLLERSLMTAIAYTDQERFGGATGVVVNREFNAFLVPATNLLNYCALYRREVWEAVGGYNPNMTYGYEDWDFWVGAVERGYRAKRFPEPLLRYRVRSGSMISTALQHDLELRRQLRANHPRLYRPWLRAARFAVRAALVLRRGSMRFLQRLSA